jgi:hypothetical protein
MNSFSNWIMVPFTLKSVLPGMIRLIALHKMRQIRTNEQYVSRFKFGDAVAQKPGSYTFFDVNNFIFRMKVQWI